MHRVNGLAADRVAHLFTPPASAYAAPGAHPSPPLRQTANAGVPAVILATVATPVFDPVLRARIARHADIVDMEGSHCTVLPGPRGPLTLLKGVTDQAGAHDRQRLLQNLDAVSITLAVLLAKLGLNLTQPPKQLEKVVQNT